MKLFDPESPGAAALRATIASTLLEKLGPGAVDPEALPKLAVSLLSSGADPDALSASIISERFLEASVAKDFSVWLLDHVRLHASDYGFGAAVGGELLAAGNGNAMMSQGQGFGGYGGGGGDEEEERRRKSNADAAGAGAAGAAGNVSEYSNRGGRGRGRGRGGFARGGSAGRGRGGVRLGISRGGGGSSTAGVSKASSSRRSVFDRLGAGAPGAAADAAAAATAAPAAGRDSDDAMTAEATTAGATAGAAAAAAAVAAAAAATAAAATTATASAVSDPARLKALREELVRLRQEAIKSSGAVAGATTASGGAAAAAASTASVSSLAAGRTVLVKNVHFDATDASLAEHFRAAGLAVERATIARAGAGGGPSKGYGVVALLSVEAAGRALALAGSTLEGREIDVVPARPTGIALEEGVFAGVVGGRSDDRGRGGVGGFRGGRGRGRGRAAAAVAARGRGRGRFSRSSSSLTYVRPELAAERAAEAAAARRAALDAELDALAAGRG